MTFELPTSTSDTPTFQMQFLLNDGATPINLTNYAVSVYILNPDESVLATITAAVTDAANGKIQFSMTAAQTAQAGSFEVIIKAVNGGTVLTLDKGVVVIQKVN